MRKKYYCKICKKEKSKHGLRCQSCATKMRWKETFKNCSFYIDGRTLKTYYCKVCKKEICYKTWKYGSKMCKSCIMKKIFKNNPEFRSGKNNWNYGKKGAHGKGEYYKGSWMRSSWEIKYAKYCIKNHIKYRYEPEAFPITYTYEGIKKEGTYRPDFYLPETDKYIEIKGWWRGDGKVKFKAFKRKYKNINIKLVDATELKSLNIKK